MESFHDVSADPLRPSLFELVAQEQLGELLQPAVKYILSVFAQRYPRYLIKLVNRHEEFYALLMFFVERHHLREHNASFSEHFYGLKRRRVPFIEAERAKLASGVAPPEERLRDREIARSLLFLIGVPYLRAKLQNYYEDLGGGVDPDIQDATEARRQAQALSEQTVMGHFRNWFKTCYPYAHTAFEIWLFVYDLAYLFDRTKSYRPWLNWIGVDLRRLGIEDMRAAAQRGPATPLRPRSLRSILSAVSGLALSSLNRLLPGLLLVLRFLTWWYSPQSPRALAAPASGPQVPPPRLLPPHPDGVQVDRSAYGQCPLCRAAIVNATALPSGYVTCYRCAHAHVSAHGRCPVTLLPAGLWQLRKVMV